MIGLQAGCWDDNELRGFDGEVAGTYARTCISVQGFRNIAPLQAALGAEEPCPASGGQ